MTFACSGCGHPLLGSEHFCPDCGKKLQFKRRCISEATILGILNSQEELNTYDYSEPPYKASGTADEDKPSGKSDDSQIHVGDISICGDSVSANPEDCKNMRVWSKDATEKPTVEKGKPICLHADDVCRVSCPHRSAKGACTLLICCSNPPQYQMCPLCGGGYIFCKDA